MYIHALQWPLAGEATLCEIIRRYTPAPQTAFPSELRVFGDVTSVIRVQFNVALADASQYACVDSGGVVLISLIIIYSRE